VEYDGNCRLRLLELLEDEDEELDEEDEEASRIGSSLLSSPPIASRGAFCSSPRATKSDSLASGAACTLEDEEDDDDDDEELGSEALASAEIVDAAELKPSASSCLCSS